MGAQLSIVRLMLLFISIKEKTYERTLEFAVGLPCLCVRVGERGEKTGVSFLQKFPFFFLPLLSLLFSTNAHLAAVHSGPASYRSKAHSFSLSFLLLFFLLPLLSDTTRCPIDKTQRDDVDE